MSEDVASVAAALAERLPADDLRALVISAVQGAEALRTLRRLAPAGVLRAACDRLLEAAGELPPGYVAGALAGAAAAVARERASRSIDVVWTGPSSSVQTSRLTSAAVVGLLDEARVEILLVSYAAHSEPRVAQALEAAVGRGVDVTLLLERHEDNPGYAATAAPFSAVRARRLAWPVERRPDGAALHAKILVVDAATALVGSANLTGRALSMNLECGVLLRGGSAPSDIRRHVFDLLNRGELARAG